MVKIIRAVRTSRVLTPSSLACLSHIPTVNLTAGCAHGCLYCYTRGYSTFPGEGSVRLYTNTLDKLRGELSRKRKKPAAVYFSPSSDLFQPVPAVLDMAYDIISFLLENGTGVAFLTKGEIPKRHMKLLKNHAPQVRAQFGLTTRDEYLLKTFEPNAAPPDTRLGQAEECVRCGIITQVRLDPILPGLTDDDATFEAVCSQLADIGVTRIAASTLFLRPAIMHSLKRHITNNGILAELSEAFSGRERMSIHAGKSSVVPLPAETRREIYGRLIRIAGQHNIKVRLCACKNPDMAKESCSIAGEWPDVSTPSNQLDLFAKLEKES